MSRKQCDLSRKIISDNEKCDNVIKKVCKQEFLLSPKVPMNRGFRNSCSNERIFYSREKKTREYGLGRIDSKERISHDKMSWEEIDFIPHEIASDSEDSCSSISSFSTILSSSSSSEFHGWKAYSFEEENWQRIMRSKWGGYGLHLRLWEDENAPVTKIREREDLVLDTSEYCGILSDRMIGACSSFLTVSPENGHYVLTKCDLNRMKLTDLTIIRYHRYLQYLDLSHNFLSSLEPLGELSYLMFLNASHNKLKDTLRFSSPWYLTYVNLSHNDITLMRDLSEFWSIVRLDLSHNAIETISGLQNLKYLRYLNLSYNLIETASNLDHLFNIQELNLEYNYITSFNTEDPESGLNTLPNLRTLIMGHNRLSTLGFFRGAYGLRLIDLKYNKIADLLEVSNLKSLVYEVDLRGNPCTQWPNYKEVLIFSMPSVKFVDGEEVTVAEKVSATTVFAPPVELVAARTISKLVLLEQLNPPKIDASVAPYDQSSPPLVILSGPSAVKKVALGLQISEKLSNWIRYCRSYTTREVAEDEDEGKAYYSVKRDEFNDMARRGEFLSIEELLGNSYGFHKDEIATMRSENKIGITQMDLNATIQMLNRYPNVKLILVLTKDEELHRRWIEEKFHIFTWIKDSIENLLAVKIGANVLIDSPETSHSRLGFISEILNEVIDRLELPTYSMCVRPQGTGATTTDIITESRTFMPKTTKTRTQLENEERKHITFRTENFSDNNKDLKEIVEEHMKISDLKVIMDEDANVIIDDEESKRKRKKARVLFRHSILKLRGNGIGEDTEFDESISSEQSLQKFPERRVIDIEYLKNSYIETILNSRNMYIEQHQTKPGFYSLVIFTDDFENASNSLIDFIYELHIHQAFHKPICLPEIDFLHRTIVPKKVKEIVKELRESMSTAKIQRKTLLRTYGMTSWKDQMPSQTIQQPKDLINTIEKEFSCQSQAESSASKKVFIDS